MISPNTKIGTKVFHLEYGIGIFQGWSEHQDVHDKHGHAKVLFEWAKNNFVCRVPRKDLTEIEDDNKK